MSIESDLKLSYYKKIADLCPEHTVFIVQHISNKQIYVMKEISLYNKDIYNYLLVHHMPNTPIIFDVIEGDSSLFIIEEYIGGVNLQNYIEENGPMSIDKASSILSKLCDILEPFHSMNPPIIHRDIKASNVILSNSGEIFLIDFNAAKYVSEEAKSDTILLGTHGYAAPEQYGFGASNVQTDIYGLGILANFLIHGNLDRPKNSEDKLERIILRCTELNPKDRYASISDLRNAISPRPNLSLLPPGFRTHNKWKMLAASSYYIIAIALSLTLNVENSTSFIETILYRIMSFILLIGGFFIANDYMGIRSHMPFHNSTDPKKRRTGVIIGITVLSLVLCAIISVFSSLIALL